MAETKKMTKRMVFERVIQVIETTDVEDKDLLIEKLHNEIELLNKKNNSSTPTKVQIENQSIKENIIKELKAFGRPATATELMATETLKGYSNQKLTALLTQLNDSGAISRVVDKKKAYFSAN